MSLLRKIIMASCFTLIVAACILSIISTTVMRTQLINSLEGTMNSYGNASANRISTWLADKKQVLKSLKEAIEAQPFNDEAITQALKQTLTAGDLISTLYGTKNGDAYRTKGKNTKEGYDPTVRDWYQLGERLKGPGISKPFLGSTSKVYIASLVDQVVIGGKFSGVVTGNVPLAGINEVIATLNVPGEGLAFVTSSDGMIISYPDETLNNTPLSELESDISTATIDSNVASRSLSSVLLNNTEFLMSSVKIAGTDWSLVLLGNKEVLMAPIKNLIIYQVIAAAILVVLTIILLTVLIRFLLKDLFTVSNALEDIAQGQGDLTVNIKTSSQDEVGKLALNFNNFVLKLRDIIKKIDDLSNILSDQSTSSAQSVTQSTSRLNTQQNEVISVAAAIEEMSAATQQIAMNAEQTAQRATETVTITGTGRQLANTSLASINQLANEVREASKVISELSEQGNKINTIVATISGIAEQTNLLALNAAIEAARAGEQGRGFAVVADEVRVLSQRTHSSTEEISTMITALQSMTTKAVNVMQLCHELANTSVDDTNKSGGSFEEIAAAIGQINNMTVQIATASEEQTSTIGEIGKNTQAIREVSSQLQDEMDAGSKQAQKLKELANSLRKEVAKFKL